MFRSAHLQSIQARLESSAQLLWHWISDTPVAFKVIGLVVLPLLVSSIGGAWVIRGQLDMILQAHGDQSFQADVFLTLTRHGVIVLGAVALFGLALAILFTRVLLHPLQDLVRAIHRVQAGDFEANVSVWAQDEIGQVQAEFNRMVNDLRESREMLVQQQHDLEQLNQSNRQLLVELSAKNSRLEQLLHHAISAQETERKRLARELHDETGQSLTSILLRLKALQNETDLV